MKRLYCILSCIFLLTTCLAKAQKKEESSLKYGKYGCVSSSYNNGSVSYTPKGSFVIEANGKYTYNGFEKPSTGKFKIDAKGNLLFSGGYLDKGIAEKIDRPDKFFVTFPLNPDHRWTCSLVR